MEKFNLSITILAGVGLVGIFILIGMDKSIDIVLPIVTFLCGSVVGLNKNNVVGAVKSVFGR